MDPNDVSKNNNTSKLDSGQARMTGSGGGLADLPPLDTAEDETFSPPPAPPEIGSIDDPTSEEPVLGSTVTQAAKPSEERSDGKLPPLPSEPSAEASSGVTDTGSPEVAGAEKPRPKKKINKKTIVGGMIALVLLIGVPLVALNIDKFSGDIRQRAYVRRRDKPEERSISKATPKAAPKGKVAPDYGEGKIAPDYGETTDPQWTPAVAPLTKAAKKKSEDDPPPQKVGGTTPKPTAYTERDSEKCASGYFWNGKSCERQSVADDAADAAARKKAIAEIEKHNQELEDKRAAGGTPIPIITASPENPLYIDRSAPTVWNNGCTDKTEGTPCFSRSSSGGKGTAGVCKIISGQGGANTEGACVASGGTTTTTTSTSSDVAVDGGGGGEITTTAVAGVCVEVRIYTLQSGAWVITSTGQIGQYAGVGDKVRLAVRGNSSQFSQGRFRVNGGAWVATTQKNSAGEFYIEYTLSQTGTYTIEGQVQ